MKSPTCDVESHRLRCSKTNGLLRLRRIQDERSAGAGSRLATPLARNTSFQMGPHTLVLFVWPPKVLGFRPFFAAFGRAQLSRQIQNAFVRCGIRAPNITGRHAHKHFAGEPGQGVGRSLISRGFAAIFVGARRKQANISSPQTSPPRTLESGQHTGWKKHTQNQEGRTARILHAANPGILAAACFLAAKTLG